MNVKAPDITESVGFTGTRLGMSRIQKERVRFKLTELKRLGFKWFHHGSCRGADYEAHCIAKELGFKIAVHPPLYKKEAVLLYSEADYAYPDADYLERNRGIVNQTQLLIAAPHGPERKRSGTWYTIRYAREIARPQYLV
jgi:hypothetical protein